MIELLLFAFIIFTSYKLGDRIIFPGRQSDFDAAFAAPLGLALIGYIVYILGSIGFLYRLPVFGAVLIFFIAASFTPGLRSKLALNNFLRFSRYEWLLFLVILLFPLITLFGALTPAIGTDSLSYHLGIPKQFILQHRIGYIPYTMNSLYPLLFEMFFTLGIILKSAVLAKLFHWGAGIMLAICVYFFTREVSNRKTGLLASLLVISSPGIFNEMVYAYIDVGLSLYIALAVFLLIFWMREEGANPRYLIFSGLFLGFSFSIKYVAMYAAIPMAFVLLGHLIRSRSKTGIIKPLMFFILPCIAVSFFWYLKSYIVLGNPVFPAFSNLFNIPIKFDVAHHFDMGMGKSLAAFLKLPWNLSIHPLQFGGRGSQAGIQYLFLLPFILFGFIKGGSWFRKLACISFGYILIWFFMVQRDRFLYPALPLFAVLIGYSIYVLFTEKWKFKKIFSALSILIILVTTIFNLGICVYHNRHNYKVTLGLESRKDYLRRWVTNYGIAQYINSNLPSDAKILGVGIYKVFYFDRWIVREKLFELWEGYREKYKSPKQMIEFLKNKGFTHILYKRINNADMPNYLKLITFGKKPMHIYGPVENIEKPQKEQFLLYKI